VADQQVARDAGRIRWPCGCARCRHRQGACDQAILRPAGGSEAANRCTAALTAALDYAGSRGVGLRRENVGTWGDARSTQQVFSPISAALLGLSIVITIAFVFAYLAVFDWTLIWVIEYSDVAKFWLMGVALLAAFLTVVNSVGSNVYLWLQNPKSTQHRIVVVVTIGVWLVGLIFELVTDYIYGTGHIRYHFLFFTSIMFVIGLIGYAHNFAPRMRQGDWWVIYNFFVLLIIAVTFFGGTMSEYVKVVNKTRYLVSLKDNSTIDDSNVIMLLQHHSIFYVDNRVVLIPSAEIKGITAAAK